MYNRRECNEKHRMIEERLREGEVHMDRMDKKLDRIFTTIIVILIAVLTVLLQNNFR